VHGLPVKCIVKCSERERERAFCFVHGLPVKYRVSVQRERERDVSKVWLTFVDKWAHSPIIMLTLIMMSTPKDETHHKVYTHHG
jgi:hypothetical protein